MRRLWALGKLWNNVNDYMQLDAEDIDKIDRKLIEGIFKTNMSDVQFLKKREDQKPELMTLEKTKSNLINDRQIFSKGSYMKSEKTTPAISVKSLKTDSDFSDALVRSNRQGSRRQSGSKPASKSHTTAKPILMVPKSYGDAFDDPTPPTSS